MKNITSDLSPLTSSALAMFSGITKQVVFYGLLIYSISVLGLTSVQAANTVQPVNTAARRGETVQLDCAVSVGLFGQYIRWLECASSSTCNVVASDAYTFGPTKYSVQQGPGTHQYNLQVLSLTQTDAGRYQCANQGSVAALFDAQIICLAGAISCTRDVGDVAVEGSVVRTTCSVGYSGQWAPRVRFYYLPDGLVTEGVADKSDSTTVKYRLDVNVTRQMNGRVWGAEVYFEAPSSPGANAAPNAPVYTDKTNLRPLEILYPPIKADIKLIYDPSFYVGDYIICAGTTPTLANPPPEFLWVDINNGSNIVGQAGVIHVPNKIGQEQNYQCIVRNKINGKVSTVTVPLLFSPQDVTNLLRIGDITAIVLGAFLVASLCVIAVIVFIIGRFKCETLKLRERIATLTNIPASNSNTEAQTSGLLVTSSPGGVSAENVSPVALYDEISDLEIRAGAEYEAVQPETREPHAAAPSVYARLQHGQYENVQMRM